MGTKVIVLGSEKYAVRQPKKIEVVRFIDDGTSYKNSHKKKQLSEFKNIELICRWYTLDGLDLMFAYDDDRNDHSSILFLGQFNNGVV